MNRALSSHRLPLAVLTLALGTSFGIAGCTDDGEADGTGGKGGTGGTSPSTTGQSTSSTGGATSASGGSGGTGSGGSGGSGTACLDASATADYFTFQTTDLCAVAKCTAAELDLQPFGASPTWGKHGGPLTGSTEPNKTTATTTDIHVVRWTLSGTTLTSNEKVVNTSVETDDFSNFFGPQLVDMPSGDTAASYTGGNFTTDGGVLLLSDTKVDTTVSVTGVFGFKAALTGSTDYAVYTGLSAMNGTADDKPGLYTGTFTGTTFGTSKLIEAWGDSTGPVGLDSAKSALVIMSDSKAKTQELRGFTQQNQTGQKIFSIDGFGSEFTVVAPSGSAPGLALFQPELEVDGNAVDQDVIVSHYTVASNTISGDAPKTIFKLKTAGTHITLMTDDKDQVWLGTENVDNGAKGSVFFLLARP